MAVLCQKIIDAEYAFVMVTTNPQTNETNKMNAEAVVGLAETLVRNAPGQALVFTVVKDKDMDEVRPIVGSYLNKATPLQGGDFIFRRTVTRKSWMGSVGRGYTNMFRKAIRGRAVEELRRDPKVLDAGCCDGYNFLRKSMMKSMHRAFLLMRCRSVAH